MTSTQIAARAAKTQVPFELAIKIRKLLDEARKSYGAEDWESDGIESTVLELVTEEA